MFKTHLVFSLLVSLLTFKYFGLNPYIFILVCTIVGTLPDIDHPKSKVKIPIISKILNFFFGHRKLIHSLFFAAILAFLIHYFFGRYYLPFIIGYLSHIVLDSLTFQGINFIYPIKQFTLKGPIKTGGFLEKVLFVVLVVLNVIVLIYLV
ncbi:MAG: metal-dependent hydrolase [Nanoarchaeota archaeon]|nr:metal-dependent hydrolase [Nanoarchaeota archaeon]